MSATDGGPAQHLGGKSRPSGEPSASVDRKVRILLELIRNKFVTVSRLCAEYETSERSLLRDFQELRAIGMRAGFTLNEKIENDQMRMTHFESRPSAFETGTRDMRNLIQDTAHAFGKPVEQQLAALGDAPAAERTFLRFLVPKLREDSRVADVYRELEDAWRARARITFMYAGKQRCVEPGSVLLRSGRYYLVARDPNARDWRYYALDKIEAPIKRAGSFSPQPIPERYTGGDVIGFQQGKGEHQVSVWLSPAIAVTATSREWQRGQQIESHADDAATITFNVSDVDEVVRWALGFGAEARVCSPESAVAKAREIAERIRRNYE